MFSEEAASRLTRRVFKSWAVHFSSAKVGSPVRRRRRRRRKRKRRRRGKGKLSK